MKFWAREVGEVPGRPSEGGSMGTEVVYCCG